MTMDAPGNPPAAAQHRIIELKVEMAGIPTRDERASPRGAHRDVRVRLGRDLEPRARDGSMRSYLNRVGQRALAAGGGREGAGRERELDDAIRLVEVLLVEEDDAFPARLPLHPDERDSARSLD